MTHQEMLNFIYAKALDETASMELNDIKRNLNNPVLFEDKQCKLIECILWLDKNDNQFKYSLILQDSNFNSTRRVSMERVETILN